MRCRIGDSTGNARIIDVGNFEHHWDPRVVVPSNKYNEFDPTGRINRYFIENRQVLFVDETGTTRPLELGLYTHVGADITLGTIADNADGTRTFTPTKDGYALYTAGGLVPTGGKVASQVAGFMLGDYYTSAMQDDSGKEAFRHITLTAGDTIWVVKGGDYVLPTDAGVLVADEIITYSGSTAGKVSKAADWDTTTTATLKDSILRLLPGQPQNFAYGYARGATASGLTECRIILPGVYTRY